MLRRIILILGLAVFCCSAAMAGETGAKNPQMLIETSMGNIKLELFAKEAPLSVKNFLDYASSGHYSGTVFHRVIPGFMIQGGGLTAELQPKPTKAPIKNEASNGLKNDRGTVAMARTANPDSATSQFFINVVDNENLNRPKPDGAGYTVFGKVIDGMDVVDKIAATPTSNKNMVFQNVPVTPVVIKSVKVLK